MKYQVLILKSKSIQISIQHPSKCLKIIPLDGPPLKHYGNHFGIKKHINWYLSIQIPVAFNAKHIIVS